MESAKDTLEKEVETNKSLPHPAVALIPVIVLVCLIALTIVLFGNDALAGGNQVALIVATGVCVCLSMWIYHIPWNKLEEAIKQTICSSAISIMILLIIGMLSGAWMVSGVVPTMIYYGIQIMNPTLFLVSTCAICAIISVMTGSSWTTVATIGVALLGIGDALGVPSPWIAGAVISGSYFGDKISPLSDTTVLASSSTDTDLFVHIRYMLYTTTPSLVLALIVFTVAGFWYGGEDAVRVSAYTEGLDNAFNISLWTLVVPVITALLIAKKVPSLITLFVSALIAGVFAVIFQSDALLEIAGAEEYSAMAITKGLMIVYCASTSVDTGSEALNDLVSTGGMAGMMNTIWLILCAMSFGGVMVASGMLKSLMMVVLKVIKGTVSLVSSTVCTGLLMNVVTSDQYISIILTASMFKDLYKEKGYESRLLSRTTEDSVTVTSVLVPWNTCGMTQATVLGVPTLVYLPYCVFNYVSPLVSIVVAALGWKIRKNKKVETAGQNV